MGNSSSRDFVIAAIPLSIAAVLIYQDRKSRNEKKNAKTATTISRANDVDDQNLRYKKFRSSRRIGDEETPCSTCDDNDDEYNEKNRGGCDEYNHHQNDREGGEELTQSVNTTSIDEEIRRELEEMKQRRAEMAKDASRVRRSAKNRYGENNNNAPSSSSPTAIATSTSFEANDKYSSPSSSRHRNNYKTLGITHEEINNSPSVFHNSRISRHEDVIGDVIDQDILFHRNNEQFVDETASSSPARNNNMNSGSCEETSASRYHYETYYVSPTSRSNKKSGGGGPAVAERYVGAMTVSSSANNSLNASPFTSVSRSRGAGRVIFVEKDFSSSEDQRQQQQETTAASDRQLVNSSIQRAVKRNHLAGSEIPGMQAGSLRGEASRPVSEFLLLDPEIRKEIKREASIRTYKEQQQRRDETYQQLHALQNTGAFEGNSSGGIGTNNVFGESVVVDEDGNEIFAPGERQQPVRGSIRYTSMRHQRQQNSHSNNNNNHHEEFGQHMVEGNDNDNMDDEEEEDTKDFKKPPRFHHVAQSEEQADQERFQQVVELLLQEHEDGASGVARFEARERLNVVRQQENWMKKQQQQ